MIAGELLVGDELCLLGTDDEGDNLAKVTEMTLILVFSGSEYYYLKSGSFTVAEGLGEVAVGFVVGFGVGVGAILSLFMLMSVISLATDSVHECPT